MCSCGCQAKSEKAQELLESKTYVCIQCNTFKTVKASDPVPECCGKKMSEMD